MPVTHPGMQSETSGRKLSQRTFADGDAPNRRAGELLARMARGDETALLLLYSQLSGTIYACTLRILSDVEEAKDATEEIFFRLWSRADRYDPSRCSALAWILTVARRFALDRKRAITRRASAMPRRWIPKTRCGWRQCSSRCAVCRPSRNSSSRSSTLLTSRPTIAPTLSCFPNCSRYNSCRWKRNPCRRTKVFSV